MAEHTPGPYEIWGEDEQMPKVPCIEIGRGKIPSSKAKSLCLVQSTLNEETGEFALNKEDRANAHLFAAAAELLEALKCMTVLAQNMRDAIETGQNIDPEMLPSTYFNQAWAAIRKAEPE